MTPVGPDETNTGNERAVNAIAEWLVTACRTGSLYDRAQIAARLKSGLWTTDEPRRTAHRDAAPALAQAERWLENDRLAAERALAAKVALAAGATPMHDRLGRPVGSSMKSFRSVGADLGFLGGTNVGTRVYEYPADGTTQVYDGYGNLLEVWPNGRRPRRQTRLAGHAFRAVKCLRCKQTKGEQHAGCECGEWSMDGPCWRQGSMTEQRRWHAAHKTRVRQDRAASSLSQIGGHRS